MSTDPFSLVYGGIWTMLEAHDGFSSASGDGYVKAANRVKYSGTARNPLKDSIRESDMPEVELVPADAPITLPNDSNGSLMDMNFRLGVITGDKRLTEVAYPVLWEIVRALSAWRTHLATLTWNSKAFVFDARPVSGTFGAPGGDIRAPEGWTLQLAYRVRVQFTTADLLPGSGA